MNRRNLNTPSNDNYINRVAPNKITKKVIVKKVEKLEDDEESEKNEEIKEENESNKNDKYKIKNDFNDNNEVSESLNDNEGEMYIYKSTQHIPVTGESTQNLNDQEKLSKTEKNIEDILESNEKEPKKRKKKIVKRKKIKQIIQQGTQNDIESEQKANKT